MEKMSDLYAVLNLNKKDNPSKAEIKKAYYKLAKEVHPDRCTNSNKKQEHGAKFLEISKAYEILSDDNKRKNYDAFGVYDGNNGTKSQTTNTFDNVDFSHYTSMFSQMFGSGFEPAENGGGLFMRHSAGRLNLNDVLGSFNNVGGGNQNVTLRSTSVTMPCTLEEITSEATKTVQISGTVYNKKGQLVRTKNELITVQLKRHWKSGTLIRYPGLGDEIENQPHTAQEGIVRMVELPHSRFHRDKNDLISHVIIDLRSALVGFNCQIRDISGQLWDQAVDHIISPDNPQVTIKGAGMFKKDGTRGDIVIDCYIQFPKALSQDAKEQLGRALQCFGN